MQTAKIIGLRYEGETHYAMFINIRAFDSSEEIRLLGEYAGIAPGRAYKYLLISPLDRSGYGGNFVFSNMPGDLQPREAYSFAFDLLRERWEEFHSGDVLNIDAVAKRGLAGLGVTEDYVIK
ncbi:MAG: hypothetical protein H6Q67_1969 [Firmicutes bacterium]|nr:hypothetical protein [Bacillota bacterium]